MNSKGENTAVSLLLYVCACANEPTREIMLSIVARFVRHTQQLYTLVPDRYVRCLKPILYGCHRWRAGRSGR